MGPDPRTEAATQPERAAERGKPPSFVGKYEIGERRLDVIELMVILKVLGLDLPAFCERIEDTVRLRL